MVGWASSGSRGETAPSSIKARVVRRSRRRRVGDEGVAVGLRAVTTPTPSRLARSDGLSAQSDPFDGRSAQPDPQTANPSAPDSGRLRRSGSASQVFLTRDRIHQSSYWVDRPRRRVTPQRRAGAALATPGVLRGYFPCSNPSGTCFYIDLAVLRPSDEDVKCRSRTAPVAVSSVETTPSRDGENPSFGHHRAVWRDSNSTPCSPTVQATYKPGSTDLLSQQSDYPRGVLQRTARSQWR